MHEPNAGNSRAASRAASRFARAGLLVYALLVVYASWYPFSGWRISGISPLAYLSAPLPHYWTGFDVGINVVGYVPLGMLLVLAWYPHLRGWVAAILAGLACIMVSGTMEAVQTFLPSRVASNLDLLTNGIGGCAGALAGALLTRAFLEQSWLLQLRRAWFSAEAGHGLVLLAFWPLAQVYPQGYLFGHGQLLPILADWLSDWSDSAIDLGALLGQGVEWSAQQYALVETAITAFGFCGAGLALVCLMRPRAPRVMLLLQMIAAALVVKTLASALQFGPDNARAWLTPGAARGLLLGMAMLAGSLLAGPTAQRRLAIACLLLGVTIVNAAPANPYFAATLQTWVQGKFLNFNGAAQFLALAWPFIMLWQLLHPATPEKPA